MSELLIFLLLSIATLTGVGYYYVRKQYAYFKDRNIPYAEPSFPLGNIKGFGTKYHASQLVQQIYKKFSENTKVVGMFFFTRPIPLILDPELIKGMFVRDFNNFTNHGIYHDEEHDPLSAHLFSLEGNKWRRIRNKLSPTFTSGKMKMMFDIIAAASEEMAAFVKTEADKCNEIEFKDLFGRYGTDVIGNCAFGLNCNSMKEPENEFREMGRKAFEPDIMFKLVQIIAVTFPNFAKKFRLKMTQKDVSEFYIRIVKENLDYRKQNNIKRNDFFQLLIELEKTPDSSNDDGLTFNEIAAQAFIFFLAGFETSSTTLSFCIYELGRHPEIQQKIRDEIETVLKKHDGKITYEAIIEMTYLNQVIHETLRLYPPVDSLNRIAEKDYNFPDTPYTISKGTLCLIPIYSIQRDSRHFVDPEKFDPNRFSDEEIAKRHPFTFLPFGEGPRMCIGMRFGLMQVRLGLVALLRKFKLSYSDKTPKIPFYKPSGQTLMLDGGVWMKIETILK